MIVDFEERVRARGGSVRVEGFPGAYKPILEMMRRQQRKRGRGEPPPRNPPFPEQIGRWTLATCRDCWSLIGYLGQVTLALAWTATHPHRMRWRDAFRCMQAAGAQALPVVALVTGMMGLILSYQTADAFRRYGADIYLAGMLGLSLVRELGPLVTAILVSARSGSAFAAEIGTMRVNEEIDALHTMGVDPVRFLFAPRIFAAVLMIPLLTVFAVVSGLLGGAVVWVLTLELPLSLYRLELQETLELHDYLGGLFKSLVFGMLVAAVGCIRGLQAGRTATDVGASATSAVVSGIVLIALADLLFSVVYFHLGI